jgi:hypothetical protein
MTVCPRVPGESGIGPDPRLDGTVTEEGRNAVRGLRLSQDSLGLEQAFSKIAQEVPPQEEIEPFFETERSCIWLAVLRWHTPRHSSSPASFL